MDKDKPYDKKYLLAHDIDWFFSYKGKPIHAASFSGIIPKQITVHRNREIQSRVYSMEPISEYNLESDLSNSDLSDEQKLAYLHSFIEMAQRGFYSFDRVVSEPYYQIEESDNKNAYKLIASPTKLYDDIESLPILDNEIIFLDGDLSSFEIEE